MMQEATDHEPKMWGTSIIGFGSYHYKYESGHEGDAPLVAFSPRAKEFVLYLGASYPNRETLMDKLGKHKSKGGCLYVKNLADVNEPVLLDTITAAYQQAVQTHAGK